jgi:hypothetical protein
MKFLNDFKNIFAVLGIVSIIFWTCSAESSSDDNSSNLPPQLTGGTYQVEILAEAANPDFFYIVALNVETGVMKTYKNNNGNWSEAYSEINEITFTH